MKLPAAKRTGTDVTGSLGRDRGPTFAESKAIERQSKGFLGTGLTSRDFGTMADAAMYITNLQGKRQQQQADIKMTEAEGRFQEQYGGKEFFEIDEIPNEFVTDDMLARGTRVPSYEVLPQIYNEYMNLSLDQASEGIATAGFRDDWKANKQEMLAGRQTQINVAAMESANRQVLKDQMADMENQIANRRPDVASMVVADMDISDEQRRVLNEQVNTATEIIEYEDLIIAQDLNGMQQAVAKLRQDEEVYKKSKGALNTKDRVTWISKLESQISNIQKQNQAEVDYNLTLVKRDISLVQKNALDGKATNPEDIIDLVQRAENINAQTGGKLDKELADVKASLHAYEVNNELIKNNRFQREAMIDNVHNNPAHAGLSSFEKDQLQIRMEQSHRSQTAAENDDLMQAALDAEAIQQLAPIGTPEGIVARMQQYEIIKQRYGDVGKGPLTKEEALQYSSLLNNMNAQQQMQVLAVNAQALGLEANIIYDQLRTDGTATSLAIAGIAANNGRTEHALAILNGAEYRKQNPEMVNQLNNLFIDKFRTEVGNAYFTNASLESSTRDAIMDAYVHYARSAGIDLNTIDTGSIFGREDLYQKSLEAATGGIITQGATKIPAPEYGMSQSKWDDWLNQIDYGYIDELGGAKGLSSVQVLDGLRRGNYSLYAQKENQFFLRDSDGGFLHNADGTAPFVFRYDAAAPRTVYEASKKRRKWFQ